MLRTELWRKSFVKVSELTWPKQHRHGSGRTSQATTEGLSTLVCVHGFPDSSELFEPLLESLAQPSGESVLQRRKVIVLDLPNRERNREGLPSFLDVMRDRVRSQVHEILAKLAVESPTQKLVIICHDWGANYVWSFVRAQMPLRSEETSVQALVAFSVGPYFRYDMLEHGIGALVWQYSSILMLAYYLPFWPVHWLIWKMLTMFGGYPGGHGYQGLEYDAWHYAPAIFNQLTLLPDLVGLNNMVPFRAPDFPICFLRSEQDKIASIRAFEGELEARPDCEVHLFPNARLQHWFMDHSSETHHQVNKIVSRFLAKTCYR